MKQTLLLLALISATVSAAEPAYEYLGTLRVNAAGDGLEIVKDDVALTGPTITLPDPNTVVLNSTDNSFTTTGNDSVKVGSANSLISMGNFSVTFDATFASVDTTGYHNLLCFGEGSNYLFQYYTNDNKQWSASNVGYTDGSGTTKSITGITATAGTHSYTLVNYSVAGTGTNPDRYIQLYEDGTLLASFVSLNRRYGNAGKMFIRFGDTEGNNNGKAATFSNVKFYSGNIMVPEPATATLSLLALAGLAARRRRK